MPFDTSHDIVFLLREQWSGLFQRLLQQTSAEGQLAVARELRQGIDIVRKLVEILTDQSGSAQQAAQDAIRSVLTPAHPVFRRLQTLLKVPYRVFFTNLDEIDAWMKNRGFKPVDADIWDDEDHREWISQRSGDDTIDLIKMHVSLFDEDGRFIPESVPWKNDLVSREIRPSLPDDDDVPF